MRNMLSIPVVTTSKTTYTRMSKSEYVVARRPCGFITETVSDAGNKVRRLYLEHEGEYFTAILIQYETTEDIMLSEFHGVETEIKAKFVYEQKFITVKDLVPEES